MLVDQAGPMETLNGVCVTCRANAKAARLDFKPNLAEELVWVLSGVHVQSRANMYGSVVILLQTRKKEEPAVQETLLVSA